MARRRRSGFREGPERHLPSSACMVGNTGLTSESLGFATGDGFSVTRIFRHPDRFRPAMRLEGTAPPSIPRRRGRAPQSSLVAFPKRV